MISLFRDDDDDDGSGLLVSVNGYYWKLIEWWLMVDDDECFFPRVPLLKPWGSRAHGNGLGSGLVSPIRPTGTNNEANAYLHDNENYS